MLKLDDIAQSQSLEEPRLFGIIPQDAVRHVVAAIQATDDPIREAKVIHEMLLQAIPPKSTKRVAADLKLAWDIQGAERGKEFSNLIEGFKPNTIQKLAAWLGVIAVVYELLSTAPEQTITINNQFMIQSQTSMDIYVRDITKRRGE